MNGTQRRVHEECIVCTYSGMAKCASRAEVISNNERFKPVALAIVKLGLFEGSQAGGRPASQPASHPGRLLVSRKNSVATF